MQSTENLLKHFTVSAKLSATCALLLICTACDWQSDRNNQSSRRINSDSFQFTESRRTLKECLGLVHLRWTQKPASFARPTN